MATKKKSASERKRASNGQGSINVRADGRFKIDVSLGYDPVTGKARRKSVYGLTEKEALAKAQKLKVSADEGIFKEPAKLTVKEWCDIWLKEYTGHLAQRTRTLYEGDVNNYIIPRLGRYRLVSLNRAMVQQFVNSITEKPLQEGKPVSAKTIANIHGTLNRLLNQAVDIDYLRVNPAARAKLPRVDKTEARAMTKAELSAFRNQINGERFELVYSFVLSSGLREAEVMALTWDAVDLERGKVTIKQQLQIVNHEYKIVAPKSNKVRTVTIGCNGLDVLRRQKRIQAEWRLRAGAAWQDSGFVFTDEAGEHIKRQTLYKHFKDAVTAIGAPGLKFHSLRHTYATTAMQAGVDAASIQKAMGHYSPGFTLSQYGHAMADVQAENAEKIDAFYNNILNGR